VVDFRKKLKNANKLWAGAKKKAAESSQGSEYEDGKYLARLVKGEITESNAGRLQVAWTWKFEEEPYEGKNKMAYQGLESEDNLVFLARDLDRLGYEAPEDIATIEEILADINKSKPLARIRLKSKGDFQNVYIDKVIGGDDDDEEADEETEGDTPDDAEESDEEESDDAEEEGDDDAEESDDDAEEESDDEEEAEEEADDEVEIEVGMKVEVDSKNGKVNGEIIEILEAEGKARVRTKDKVLKVGVDKLTLIAAEEPATPPKAKAGKKDDAPAPKKKTKK
jgi:hypothetical protein